MQKSTASSIRLLLMLITILVGDCVNAQFYTIRADALVASTPGANKSKEEMEPKTSNVDTTPAKTPFQLLCSPPLIRPLYITSPYGYRLDPFSGKRKFHRGIDLRCNNEKVLAMFTGTVKKVGNDKRGLGHYVVLSHPPFEVTYAHLEYVVVEQGSQVVAGEIVAISGNTGRSTGPHLHIELRYRGQRRDPLPLLALIDKSVTLQNKRMTSIMNNERAALTALEHVQEAYREEFLSFLHEKDLIASEESATLFLEQIEDEITS